MYKQRSALLVLAGLAVSAAPARADWSWSWTNVCGGDNFVTCMSGDIFYNRTLKKVTVHVINLPVRARRFHGGRPVESSRRGADVLHV